MNAVHLRYLAGTRGKADTGWNNRFQKWVFFDRTRLAALSERVTWKTNGEDGLL